MNYKDYSARKLLEGCGDIVHNVGKSTARIRDLRVIANNIEEKSNHE